MIIFINLGPCPVSHIIPHKRSCPRKKVMMGLSLSLPYHYGQFLWIFVPKLNLEFFLYLICFIKRMGNPLNYLIIIGFSVCIRIVKTTLLIFTVKVQWKNCISHQITAFKLHLDCSSINSKIEEKSCKTLIFLQPK